MIKNKIKYADYQKAIIFCKLLLRTHEQFDTEIKIIMDGLNLYEFEEIEEDVILKENERLKKEVQELNEYLNLYEPEEDAIEQDLEHWANKAIQLEKENERLKKELNEYGKENKNNKNT